MQVLTLIATFLALFALVPRTWRWYGTRVRPGIEAGTHCLELLQARVEKLLARAVDARDSERKRLVADAIVALAPSRTIGWWCYATPDQRQLAKAGKSFVGDSYNLVCSANREFLESELANHASLFDTIESQPLTDDQRRACVLNEDNNLVIAGAGTGKTSTMIGRAGYLIASHRAQPNELLMLAFADKAADEMRVRLNERLAGWLAEGSPTVKTFHALGREIIRTTEGIAPTLHRLAEDRHAFARFIDQQVDRCCEDSNYRAMILRYCGSERFPYRNFFDFKSMKDYKEYIRTNELRTLKAEVVKSFEECVIANFLSAHGVAYRYEPPYEVNTTGPNRRQYKPDFYLPEHRVYIEHFALDKSGNPPAHFDRANYLDGIAWKRNTHHVNRTKLIETYSYLKREGRLETYLAEALKAAGVRLVPRSSQELLCELRDLGEISDFAVLLREFLNLFRESGLSLDELGAIATRDIDSSRLSLLLALFAPIFDAYQVELSTTGQIDFADMISKASDYVESGRFQSPFSHVLVDEFQAISQARARLLRALVHQRLDAVLFAVGDDWQSIYRFTGSDIAYTRDFSDHFGATATTHLKRTFRFNDKIGTVSSTFVLKNPDQIHKSIGSVMVVDRPAVSLIRTVNDRDGLVLALDAIARRTVQGWNRPRQILVLGRYHHTIENWVRPAARQEFIELYPSLAINFMTVHASKGKEADFVVILGLGRGKHGFPCEKPRDPLLELVLPTPEAYLLAEERRLFYVALTRARNRVYLVYNQKKASSFISELLANSSAYPICTDEFDEQQVRAEMPRIACPECASGVLVLNSEHHRYSVGCHNSPYCMHRGQPCPQCGGLMTSNGNFHTCADLACGGSIPICPRCGDSMIQRNGRYGSFWGCSNYSAASDFSCTYTANI